MRLKFWGIFLADSSRRQDNQGRHLCLHCCDSGTSVCVGMYLFYRKSFVWGVFLSRTITPQSDTSFPFARDSLANRCVLESTAYPEPPHNRAGLRGETEIYTSVFPHQPWCYLRVLSQFSHLLLIFCKMIGRVDDLMSVRMAFLPAEKKAGCWHQPGNTSPVRRAAKSVMLSGHEWPTSSPPPRPSTEHLNERNHPKP